MKITLIKKHWHIIILAVVLSAIMVAPFRYYKLKLGPAYQGILPSVVDDDLFYMARLQDVIDGHPTLSNAYLWEHKRGLPTQVFLAEYLMAQPLRLLHARAAAGRVAYSATLPAAALILTYVAFYQITRSRSWSGISSALIFFGIFPFKFLRPVSPQFNFIFWLTEFIFIWAIIKKPYKRWPVWLSAINFGFLFYIYPYYWTFYLTLIILLAAAYWLRHRQLSINFVRVLIGGLILAVPYFRQSYQAARLPEYHETLIRLGLIYTRYPTAINLTAFVLATLVIIIVAIRRKVIILDGHAIFFITGILASIAVLDQQIITGQNLEFSSHYFMPIVFWLVFCLAYLLANLNKNQTKYFKILKITLTAAILIVIANSSAAYYRQFFKSNPTSGLQDYTHVFTWLNDYTAKDSVVYADESLSELIPIYTADNVFYAANANLFYMSDREVADRFVINNFFDTIDGRFITDHELGPFRVRFQDNYYHTVQINKWRRLLGFKPEVRERIPQSAINAVIAHANQIHRSNFQQALANYRVDYFIWDKQADSNWQLLAKQKFLKKTYETSRFVILTK